MGVTVTFEGESHNDVVRQVRDWLTTVQQEEGHLTPAEAIEQGGELTKEALRIIAAAAPEPIARNDLVRRLTDMGYRATEATTARLVEGLARVEELTDGALVKEARETGRSAVYEMNTGIAKQLLKQFGR